MADARRIEFKPYQRRDLIALGLSGTAVDYIEYNALPIASQFLKRPPRKNDVLKELRDLQQALTAARSAIERVLDATSDVPHLKRAQDQLTGGQGRYALGGLRLGETSKSLAVALSVVSTGIAEMPPGPLRHRSADPYVIELIHNALQHGSFAASGDFMSHGLRPSASVTSGFRKMVGICYEALGVKDADPERALKAYLKGWRAMMRQFESLELGTERAPKN